MTEIIPQKNNAVQKSGYERIQEYGRSPEVMQIFNGILRGGGAAYIESAILAVKFNPQLQACTPQSIFSSALRAATLKLTCDPSLGHAWLIPYRNNRNGTTEANFQVGWRGVQHMAIRTGKYQYINVADIYEGETVVEDKITGALRIDGYMDDSKTKKGLIASFKLVGRDGLAKSIYMSNEELEAHGKQYSKAYNRTDSIWQTNKKAAYHKTILLKLLRTYGYLDPLDAEELKKDQLIDEDSEQMVPIGEVDMPNEEDVTIVEGKKLTMKEANDILGMGDDDDDYITIPADDIVSVEDDEPILTLEKACKVANSEGLTYGSMSKKQLSLIIDKMEQQIANNGLTPLESEEIGFKVRAAQTVLNAKNDGSMR